MKPIKQPVTRQAVHSLWSAFRASGRRHLILTGSKQSGKTTLLNALIGERQLPGIRTFAVWQGGLRPEAVLLEDRVTGEQTQVGLPTERGMRPRQEGFETLGIAALARAAAAQSEWAALDEIGFLEQDCPAFCDAVRSLFAAKRVLAVLRKQELPFLQELSARSDAFVVDLDEAAVPRLGCVVLASGHSTRFGSNKLLAEFLGKPLLCHTLERLPRDLFARALVVTRSEEIADLCRTAGFAPLLHALPLQSDTIRLATERMKGLDGCLFCVGDQPLCSARSFARLVEKFGEHPEAIVRLSFGGEPGNPVIFPSALFTELRALPPDAGGSAVIRRHPERVRLVEADTAEELFDVDTKQALEELTLVQRKNAKSN